jgi:hypothetical protein
MNNPDMIGGQLYIADNIGNEPLSARPQQHASAPSIPMGRSMYAAQATAIPTMPSDYQEHSFESIETPLTFTELDFYPGRDPIALRMVVVLVAVIAIFGSLWTVLTVFGEGDAVVNSAETITAGAGTGETLQPDPDIVPSADQAGEINRSFSGSTTSAFAEGSIAPVFTPEVMRWADKIVGWANQAGVDPNQAAIIMQIESCGDPAAGSSAGAQGLFQVMPFHFTAGEQMLDPDTNARRGMNYFAERMVQTNGDIGRAFAGYNGGHGAAGSPYNTWANETQRYFYWATGIWDDIEAGRTESPRLQEWLNAGGASLCRQAAQRQGVDALLAQ